MVIPTEGGMHEMTAMTAAQFSQRKDVTFLTARGRPVDYVRNSAVDILLANKESTHLFFMDSDTACPLEAIDSLLALDVPIACGCYVVLMREGPRWALSKRGTDGHHRLISKLQKQPFEVDGGGAGCLLVKREVFEKIEWPWFKWINNPDRSQLTEDIYFFNKVWEAGYKVIAHPGVIAKHYKEINITQLLKG